MDRKPTHNSIHKRVRISCHMPNKRSKRRHYNATWNIILSFQRGSYMVWEINIGVCPRFEFDIIMFINCLGYDLYIYGTFEFYAIPSNLWRHVWYHYNTLGYLVIIISKVMDILCNGGRHVLLNNYIIDKFVDAINGFVCIRIVVGGHSFLSHGTQIFNCICCIQSNYELQF